MAAESSTMKRVMVATCWAVGLPFAIGVLSGFSYFVTGQEPPPDWVHSARSVLIWLATIAVFTWFVVGQRDRLVQTVLIVMVLVGVLSECLAAGTRLLSHWIAELEGPIWSFRLEDMAAGLARAILGALLGLAIRFRPKGTSAVMRG